MLVRRFGRLGPLWLVTPRHHVQDYEILMLVERHLSCHNLRVMGRREGGRSILQCELWD